MNNETKKIVLNGLMIALVCIATMTIQIPMPGTNGYVNIGDSVIFISSILFGPVVGMIAGGIGSALADILSGYEHWAIFTLIIKGLEGYVVGIVIRNHYTTIKSLFATALGTITMVTGYFLAGIILKGSIIISAASIPGNLIQGIVCMAIAILLSHSLAKVKYVKTFKAHS
ncbi:ECF transporter S component [Paeniclostridium sp. NSJ-45]|uniref:ECF transporter S component n=1 Tax=Paeniclostridium hominis TaxID=2764329 RepID=A0ABR7K3C6_9FIRM|nr:MULTISPECIES: ECF transporter S component [Paeniclostridium]MBC6003546.1 ECF transporter S component [Paeniclostridium hominis]